jgi:hypothetical protein
MWRLRESRVSHKEGEGRGVVAQMDQILAFVKERGFYVDDRPIKWDDTTLFAAMEAREDIEISLNYMADLIQDFNENWLTEEDRLTGVIGVHFSRTPGPIYSAFNGFRKGEKHPQNVPFQLDVLHTIMVFTDGEKNCEVMILPNKK